MENCKMTSRERILAAVAGEQTDRVPVAPFVHTSTVQAWRQDSKADVLAGTVDFCRHFGFDLIHRNFNVRHDDFVSRPNWDVSQRAQRSGNETRMIREITTPAGVLREVESLTQLTPYQTVSAQVECLIKTEEDFEIFRRYAPPPSSPDFSELHRVQSLVGQDGVTAPWLWGVFNYMAKLYSLEDLITAPYMEPDFYAAFAGYVLNRLKKAAEPLLEQKIDFVSYTGNLANGTMTGPAYFAEHVLPYEKELVGFLQSGGIKVIYHNCGDGASMIDCYNQLMPDCYESMTEPPFGDNSLEDCLLRFDSRIALMGNIDQITFLRQASPKEVEARAVGILQKAAGRERFILGTSDLLEEGTPEENLFALANAPRVVLTKQQEP